MRVKVDKILGDVRESDYERFIFTQGTASTVWTINHNLGRKPSVSVIENGTGCRIFPAEVHTDDNNLTLTFLAATAGTAELN